MDYSLPGFSVHGILQEKILECVAIPFSRGSFQPKDQNPVSGMASRFFTVTATSASSVQYSSVTQSCLTLCDAMDYRTPGFPVYHQLRELAQTHVHQVSDAFQPSHPLSSHSPAFNLSQHQGLFQSVTSSHQMAKVLASASVLPMHIQD